MRFLRRLTLLAIAAGVFAWLRKVMSEEVLDRAARRGQPEPPPPPTRTDHLSGSTAPAATTAAPPQRAAANRGEPTKAELYGRAQQLGIEGRSKMSKAELERAIREASG